MTGVRPSRSFLPKGRIGAISATKRLATGENILVKGVHDVLSGQAFSPSEFLQASLAPGQPVGYDLIFKCVADWFVHVS